MLGISRVLNEKIRKSAQARFFRNALRQPPPREFTHYPEPTNPGDYARGLSWLSGEIFHENEMLSAPTGNIWEHEPVSHHVTKSLHSFDWIDDLAAVGTTEATQKIRLWTKTWLERYAKGDGPGWDLSSVSWRVIRLITHAKKNLPEGDLVSLERLLGTLGVHIKFIAQYYQSAANGLEKIVALSAWIFGAISLKEFESEIEDLTVLLDDQASLLIHGEKIVIASRNPEEMLKVFSLLVWIESAMNARGQSVGDAHDEVIELLGRGVRSLRLGTGKLIEAHGGGPSQNSTIDRVLATADVGGRDDEMVLGYAHVRAGKIALIMDCEEAPSGSDFGNSSASTLALWVSDGNQMLLASEGCAKNHSVNAQIANQETMAYSALSINGESTCEFALLGAKNKSKTSGAFIEKSSFVSYFNQEDEDGKLVIDATQNGFIERFGLKHDRMLSIDRSGDQFQGLDRLQAFDQKSDEFVKKILKKSRGLGLPFAIQFILGPKVQPHLDHNSTIVTLKIPGGRTWQFKQAGGQIAIEDRAIYDIARINLISTKAIVVHAQLTQTSVNLAWEFKAIN